MYSACIVHVEHDELSMHDSAVKGTEMQLNMMKLASR